jgi:CheY-like chemotaxis protein
VETVSHASFAVRDAMARPWEVLYADDSVAHTQIAREAFLAPGLAPHRLALAVTGAEALDRIFLRPPHEAARRPDLLLLDLDLPVVSGLDVLAAVKADPATRSIPIVVLTRAPRAEDLAACYALGANSVVDYPVPLEALAETFRRVFDYWTAVNVLDSEAGR